MLTIPRITLFFAGTACCLLTVACGPEEIGNRDSGASPEDGAVKGECTHPHTGTRDTEVECLVDPCSTARCEGDPDATCEANYCGGCHAVFTASDGSDAECEPVACPADAKLCPDGSSVGRRGKDCAFAPCPDSKACTEDAKVCPDGSAVARDPENDCQFPDCPEDIGCDADAKQCPDGSSVGRDPQNGCSFEPCPDPTACTADAKVCPDGSAVARDPENDCQFPDCPQDIVCPADAKECPDGSYVSRDPENDCAFALCEGECRNPETGEADTEVQCFADPCSVTTCDAHPDADCTANYCGGCHALFTDEAGERVSCEQVACTADAKQCPDGSWVGRDGTNDCEWKPCP